MKFSLCAARWTQNAERCTLYAVRWSCRTFAMPDGFGQKPEGRNGKTESQQQNHVRLSSLATSSRLWCWCWCWWAHRQPRTWKRNGNGHATSNRELEREQEREWEAGLVGWWCQGADDKACDSILHTLMNPSSLLNVTSSNPQRLVILCERRQQTRRRLHFCILYPASCILNSELGVLDPTDL